MTYSSDSRYTKEHEWVRTEGGIGVIGITDHAQRALGDIVYVDLPKPGTRVEKGKTLGSVESVKAVSDVYAPVSGEVIEVNEMLTTSPEKLIDDPHGEAWLVKVRMSDPVELADLLSASDYQNYAEAEEASH
jgi:glycine cleavage system H protein